MMRAFGTLSELFVHWLESVATLAAALVNRVAPSPIVVVTEDKDGQLWLRAEASGRNSLTISERIRFDDGRIVEPTSNSLAAIFSGNRVEVTLQSHRFLFQQMDLPSRAVEFLDGIVRTQIDQLTPWTAMEAVFGWTKPSPSGSDRVLITVVAAALSSVRPYVQALSQLGASSVSVFTRLDQGETDAPPVKILEEAVRSFDVDRIRRMLFAALAASGVGAAACLGLSAVIGASLDDQEMALTRQIATARHAMTDVGDAAVGSRSGALQAAAQRKNRIPSVVIVIDTLSQILPDDTFLLALNLQGEKLRLTGVTRDAASLIGIIERSGRFSRTTFFAPTTKVPSESGERFHIETQIQSVASSNS